MTTDKRMFKRYVFAIEDNITALLSFDNSDEGFMARVLNISHGGLGLAINKTQPVSLEADTILFVKEIKGEKRITNLPGNAVKVKWVLDYQPLNNFAIGCEFITLDTATRHEIDNLLQVSD